MNAPGVTLLAASAGSGKTGVAMGIARALVDRDIPVEPFKAVAVVSPDDPAFDRSPPWQWGALHNCGAARRLVQPWHNPVLAVRPEPGSRHGELYIAGEWHGAVPVPGDDLLDLGDLPPALRRRCTAAVRDAVEHMRHNGRYLVIEGAGGAGELEPEHDLANHLAPIDLGCPVVLVLNPGQSGQLAGMLGLLHLLDERLRALLAGYVANQVRDEAHTQAVKRRLAAQTPLPGLAALSIVYQPPEYDGSPTQCERIYQRRADQVSGSGLLARLHPVAGADSIAVDHQDGMMTNAD